MMFVIMAKINVISVVVMALLVWWVDRNKYKATKESLVISIAICASWMVSAVFILFSGG